MLITDTMKIERYDNLNLAIYERYETQNPFTHEAVFKWHLLGYYGSLEDALKGCLKKQEMSLVDKENIVSAINELHRIENDLIKRIEKEKCSIMASLEKQKQ